MFTHSMTTLNNTEYMWMHINTRHPKDHVYQKSLSYLYVKYSRSTAEEMMIYKPEYGRRGDDL